MLVRRLWEIQHATTGIKCVKKIIIIMEGLLMYIYRVEDRIGNAPYAMIFHHTFFPKNRVHFYLTPVRLAQVAATPHYTASAKCRPHNAAPIAPYVMILHHTFFPKNRVHFYLTPVRLAQAAPHYTARKMPAA